MATAQTILDEVAPSPADAPTRPVRSGRLRRYFRLLRLHTPVLLAASVLLLVSAALPGLTVLVFQGALDGLVRGADAAVVAGWGAAFVGLTLLAALAQVLRTAWTKSVAWRVTGSLRRELHRRMLQGGLEEGLGERLSSLLQEVDELQYGVSALVTVVRNPVTLVVLAVAAAWLAPGLALWAVVLVPVVAVVAWGSARLVERSTRRWRRARSRLAQESTEQLAAVQTLRAFGVTDTEAGRFSAVEAQDSHHRARLDTVRVLPAASVQVLAAVAIGVLLWRGAVQVQAGALEAEHLVGFIVALGLMARPMSGLAEVWGLLRRSLAALEAVDAALDRAPLILEVEPGDSLPAGALSLDMRAVRVAYGDVVALRVPSLRIAAGSRVAVVGATGAGKSTLLRLAARLQEPTAGTVFVGGIDLRGVGPAFRVAAIAVVEQRATIFARTVRENVALGRDLDDDRVMNALDAADAGFVAARGGLDAPLGEAGIDLSGGEAQRLSLARALAGEPQLLLLDEATNQVDTQTREGIARAIESLSGRCTVLCATHDLELARQADRILVLDAGEIVQDGIHDDLARTDGPYARLWGAR